MNTQDRQKIKEKFQEINSERQLASLLNKMIILTSKEPNNIPFKKITSQNLNYLSQFKDEKYNEYSIPKKNGKERIINAPDKYLKWVQVLINKLFQIVFEEHVNHNTNGFLDHRNIVRNAQPHTNKKFVLNMDIEHFFPSIHFRRVKAVLELNPFNLKEARERIAFIIANIVTYKNSLPQGAPTSPIISNIVTQKLDRRLTQLAIKNKVTYSRYADDITFSANKKIFDDNFKDRIKKIIEEENFKVNPSKTRIRTSRDRQEVTGLIVNQRVNVKRKYLKSVRTILNNWEKGGASLAQNEFDKYTKKKDQTIDFRDALRGQISFIGLVKGQDNPTYLKLRNRFEILFHKIDYSMITHDAVENKLIEDNKKMEKIILDDIHPHDKKFVEFCTSAFHQIEELINYYYKNKFSDIEELKQFMLDNNPDFKKQYKTLDKIDQIKKIQDFNIKSLIYIFEKEHYYDKKKYCPFQIRFLRDIRNDESHRCTIELLNKDKIYSKYEEIKKKWKKFKKKHQREPHKTDEEKKVEFLVRLFEFSEEKNFNKVRKTLGEVLTLVLTIEQNI